MPFTLNDFYETAEGNVGQAGDGYMLIRHNCIIVNIRDDEYGDEDQWLAEICNLATGEWTHKCGLSLEEALKQAQEMYAKISKPVE